MSGKEYVEQYDVQSYRAGDEVQIVQVLKESLSEWTTAKNPVEYWNWKYKSNPNGFECFTISDGDKIVGASQYTGLKIKIDDNIVHAHCATDLAIHADYRGKGLYTKLREDAKPMLSSDRVVSLWSSRNPIVINFEVKRGKHPLPFRITHMMRIKDVKRHLENNAANKPWSYPVLFFMRSLNSLINTVAGPMPEKMDEIKVSRINRFDPDIDDFCGKLHDYYKLTLIRDQSYLNWRYSNPEADEVVILQAQKSQEIAGFCAAEIKLGERDQYEAHILDLLCTPGDIITPYCLMNNLLTILDEMGINDVHLRVTHEHPYRLISKRCGFIDVTRWSTMKYFIQEFDGHEYFKKNIEEIASFPEKLVYLSHGDIL